METKLKNKYKKLVNNAKAFKDSGEFLPNEGRTTFWIIDRSTEREVLAQVKFSKDHSSCYLLQFEGADVTDALVINASDFYSEVQLIDADYEDMLIPIKVYERTLNPKLTLADVEAQEARLNAIDQAEGKLPRTNRFANVKTAIANRESDDEDLQTTVKTLTVAHIDFDTLADDAFDMKELD